MSSAGIYIKKIKIKKSVRYSRTVQGSLLIMPGILPSVSTFPSHSSKLYLVPTNPLPTKCDVHRVRSIRPSVGNSGTQSWQMFPVPFPKPGVHQNIAMHYSPTARNFLLVLISTFPVHSSSFFLLLLQIISLHFEHCGALVQADSF